jgi:hypothetical protein
MTITIQIPDRKCVEIAYLKGRQVGPSTFAVTEPHSKGPMRSDARAANIEMTIFIEISHRHVVIFTTYCGADIGEPVSLSVSKPNSDTAWAIYTGCCRDQIRISVSIDVIYADSIKFL